MYIYNILFTTSVELYGYHVVQVKRVMCAVGMTCSNFTVNTYFKSQNAFF